MHSDGTEENQQNDQQGSRVEAAGTKNLNPENEAGKDQQGQRKTSMEVLHPVLQAGSTLVFDFASGRGIRASRFAAAGVTSRGGRAIGYGSLEWIREDREEMLILGARPSVAIGAVGEANRAGPQRALIDVAGDHLKQQSRCSSSSSSRCSCSPRRAA